MAKIARLILFVFWILGTFLMFCVAYHGYCQPVGSSAQGTWGVWFVFSLIMTVAGYLFCGFAGCFDDDNKSAFHN